MTEVKRKAGFKELNVYQEAYGQAMDIYILSNGFPASEKYSLTDQIRRSSRAVCTNIGEGYRKRQYPAHFTSKLSDADMENTETMIWLDFALSCKYVDKETYNKLTTRSDQIGRMLYSMMQHPEKFKDKS